MGSAGGLVLAVSGVQCQPNVGDSLQNGNEEIINTFIATGTDTDTMLGYVEPLGLDWIPSAFWD